MVICNSISEEIERKLKSNTIEEIIVFFNDLIKLYKPNDKNY
jgi:hypothetical protein